MRKLLFRSLFALSFLTAPALASNITSPTLPATVANQSAPATPSTGNTQVWTDATDKNLKAKNDAGVTTQTVQAIAAITHFFLTSIGSNGAETSAQPACGDISDAASTCNKVAEYVLCQAWAGYSLGSNTSETTLASCSVPANALGANGCADIETEWTWTSNADAKNLYVRFNSTTTNAFLSLPETTNAYTSVRTHVCNKNATGSQIGGISNDAFGNNVGHNGSAATSSVDTTAATTIYIDASQTASGDSVALVGYDVKITPHS